MHIQQTLVYLHYTLLLLIRKAVAEVECLQIFTLHFATINTAINSINPEAFLNLHYTLLLLILTPFTNRKYSSKQFTLHFATINTILTRGAKRSISLFTLHFATINTLPLLLTAGSTPTFTLHFATINTAIKIYLDNEIINLHYTLLLLILSLKLYIVDFNPIYITLCYY